MAPSKSLRTSMETLDKNSEYKKLYFEVLHKYLERK